LSADSGAGSFRPRLRDGVTLTPRAATEEELAAGEPDERGAIAVEGLYAIELGPRAWSVARQLDGVRDLDALAASSGQARDVVDETVRQLALLNALDGAGDRIVERLRRVRRGEERLPTMVLDGARFECQGSGACCRNYHFGPLKESDVERLLALPLGEAFPHVEPPYVIERLVGAQTQRYLKSVDHACVFLDADHRCGLHARFGAEAKPDLCRIYPIERLVTYDGIRTSDGSTCATFATSARRGRPLVEELAWLRPLFYGEHEILHPIVELPGLRLDFGHYLTLARSFLDVAREGRASAPATLRAIGRALAAALPVLASIELRAGEPDATVAALAARDWAPFFEEPDDAAAIARGAAAVERIVARLLEAAAARLAKVRSATAEGVEYAMGPQLPGELCEILVVMQLAARAVVAGAPPADPYFGQILGIAVGDAECDEVLRLSIRQQLFGRRLLVEDRRGAAALARLALVHLAAIVGARLSAAAEGLARARAEHLSRGHMLALRVLPVLREDALLLDEEEHAFAILEALPALARWEYPSI
jgi:Fe-S-cluster containining protein